MFTKLFWANALLKSKEVTYGINVKTIYIF